MGQRSIAVFPLIFWALMVAQGCDAPARPATSTGPKTVASLVPAATDLILAMNAGEQLVAVSNWDPNRPEISSLPRVGDYRTVDWEKLSELSPDVMIVQFAPEKIPPGLQERAARLNIELLNVRINRLEDILQTITIIGDVIGAPEKASVARDDLRTQLDRVRESVAEKEPVRTLIARDVSGLATVGGGTFIDDILTVAGGRNVIEGGDNWYPTIDRERLLALDPDVVLHLLPGASEQVLRQTEDAWAMLPQLSAVRNNRVHVLTDSDVQLPGYNVGRLAERFAELLHGETP